MGKQAAAIYMTQMGSKACGWHTRASAVCLLKWESPLSSTQWSLHALPVSSYCNRSMSKWHCQTPTPVSKCSKISSKSCWSSSKFIADFSCLPTSREPPLWTSYAWRLGVTYPHAWTPGTTKSCHLLEPGHFQRIQPQGLCLPEFQGEITLHCKIWNIAQVDRGTNWSTNSLWFAGCSCSSGASVLATVKKTLAFTDGLSSQHDPHKISWKVFDYVGKHASGVPASCIFVLLHAWTTPHVPSDLLLQKFAGYSLVFFLDFLPGQVEMHHYSVYNLAQTQTLRRTHTQVPFQNKKWSVFFAP